MKTKFRTGLFLLFAVILYLIYGSFNKPDETTETPDIPVTEASISQEDCYYLFEKNGYVVAYSSDRKTPYEYTDILVEDLPFRLAEEIRNGKYIENLEELYGFLENYSS